MCAVRLIKGQVSRIYLNLIPHFLQTLVAFPSNLQTFPSFALFGGYPLGGHHIFLEGALVGIYTPLVPGTTQTPSWRNTQVWGWRARSTRAKNAEFSGVVAARLFVSPRHSICEIGSFLKSIRLSLFI